MGGLGVAPLKRPLLEVQLFFPLCLKAAMVNLAPDLDLAQIGVGMIGPTLAPVLLMAFSALTGLATGALVSLVVFDYYLGRDFADSVQLMGLDWACTRQDGFIADQQNGKFCVFQIGE